ncbi:hypothetical protein BC826DRAFT_906439 [Russula brevipes]|nr:hypothetical protein BC826DRAFT_906439 [Russula brevipes]
MQNAKSSNVVQGQPAVLLDYVIRPGGTVVPQGIWSSENPAHVRRYTDGPPSMPIFFVDNDRVHLGLPLLAAVEGDCTTLLCANDAPPIGNCFTAYIRINWPGYDKWTTQIMTKDRTPARNTIPLKKFANRIAKAVAKFLDAAQRPHGQVPNWRVGDGDGGITKEQVILIGAVNVSQGSWQAILQINRYVMPRHPLPVMACVA